MKKENIVVVVLDGGEMNGTYLFNNVKKAENFFIKQIKEIDNNLTKENINDYLDMGTYEYDGHSIFLCIPILK